MYPNPFNPVINIEYEIPNIYMYNRLLVRLVIYNILGQEINILVNYSKHPGKYSYNFDASHLPAGIYIYNLSVGNLIISGKLLLLK